MNQREPLRGEIWTASFDPTKGREQAGNRPALVVSTNAFNHGPADLVVVIPLTSKAKGIPLHVEIHPPEGGIKQVSFIKTEDIRSVSKARLKKCWGIVNPHTMVEVEDRMRILLDI